MRVKPLTEVETFYIKGNANLTVEQLLKNLDRKPNKSNTKLVEELLKVLPAQPKRDAEPGIPGHFQKQAGTVSMTMAQSHLDDKAAEQARKERPPRIGGVDGGIHKIRPNEPIH